jgi:hypothetical protein
MDISGMSDWVCATSAFTLGIALEPITTGVSGDGTAGQTTIIDNTAQQTETPKSGPSNTIGGGSGGFGGGLGGIGGNGDHTSSDDSTTTRSVAAGSTFTLPTTSTGSGGTATGAGPTHVSSAAAAHVLTAIVAPLGFVLALL